LVALRDDLQRESEKLARSWEQHEATWLRDYLVAGVEDPRVNIQSILTRHFLLQTVVDDRRNALMQHEYRFAAVTQWLLREAKLVSDPDGRAAILYALHKGADNAEGLEIPGFVLRTFEALPLESCSRIIPNYIETFLSKTELAKHEACSDMLLETFAEIWRDTLAAELSIPGKSKEGKEESGRQTRFSLIEPACGSANEYRFLHRYGIVPLFDYTGFDLCEKNIDNARRLFPEAHFEQGNVFEIGAANKTFDFAIVQDLFEHLSLAGLEQAVAEVCRITRKGICVGFFQMDEIGEHVVRPVDDYHWNLLSMGRMKELFARHGFTTRVIHIGSFVTQQVGYVQTHNPNAYTFILQSS
jgi:hypothetical protein